MTHTVIIFEINPENLQIYVIPDDILTERDIGLMNQAHGRLTNCDPQTDGLEFLNRACDDPDNRENNEDENFIDDHGRFHQYLRYDRERDRDGTVMPDIFAAAGLAGVAISRIIASGFVL